MFHVLHFEMEIKKMIHQTPLKCLSGGLGDFNTEDRVFTAHCIHQLTLCCNMSVYVFRGVFHSLCPLRVCLRYPVVSLGDVSRSVHQSGKYNMLEENLSPF